MLTAEQRREIMSNVVMENPMLAKGGQHHNGPARDARLYSPDTDFDITINWFRSYTENMSMCKALFELFLSDI